MMSKKTSLLFLALLVGAVSALAVANTTKPLADRHKDVGLTCDACHGDGPQKPVTMSKCLACHESYAKIAERTKELEPNPHDNHLIDLECTKCHIGHKTQENYCRSCHADMEFTKSSQAALILPADHARVFELNR